MAKRKEIVDIDMQGNIIRNAVLVDCSGLPGGSGSGSITNPISYTELFNIDLINLEFGDIELLDSISNYDLLFILGSTDDYTMLSNVVIPKVGDQFNLSGLVIESGEFIIKTKTYSLGENTIMSTSISGLCSVSSSGNFVTTGDNYIGLYKVIGVNY